MKPRMVLLDDWKVIGVSHWADDQKRLRPAYAEQ
jgi:hypothetical protein